MNIGIVCVWFNRGQATVGRYLRSALDSLGHRTCVLARPSPDKFTRPGFVDGHDVWEQSHVCAASAHDIPHFEYAAWARDYALDAIFFDQNYQFHEIGKLRASGVATVGRFVWEAFSPEHAAGANEAFDCVYSLTAAEQARYAAMGIESPLLPWGCHPELLEVPVRRRDDAVYFFYPGGYLSNRKPTAAVLEAFRSVDLPHLRLVLKCQRPMKPSDLVRPREPRDYCKAARRQMDESQPPPDPAADDPRVTVIADDLDLAEYHRLFASCHVCLAPSRWEGLGLHLFEAAAFGMPVLANDIAPINEVVQHEKNGLLSASQPIGTARSGIAAHEPDPADLARAIRRLADPAELAALTQRTIQHRDELAWEYVQAAYAGLLDRVGRRRRPTALRAA